MDGLGSKRSSDYLHWRWLIVLHGYSPSIRHLDVAVLIDMIFFWMESVIYGLLDRDICLLNWSQRSRLPQKFGLFE